VFLRFPAGSLPSLRLLPNIMLKSLIVRDFLYAESSETIFTLSFPVRQGKIEAAVSCLPPRKPAVAS
jgi:hypothetical protein